jgi:A/G-specific adenine glycosylase
MLAACEVHLYLVWPATLESQLLMALTADRRSTTAFRRRLLNWYDVNKRPLPWRKTPDPYRIWVSEIMLQQTRVAAVIDYYKRFLTAFPNLQALARAKEEDVLAQWSGLGYYRRARMLHTAAKKLVAEKRRIPKTSAGLRELPGIGRYTAAAIASIAFDEPTAVVDGNVERVLLRLAGKNEHAVFDHWSAAQALLDPSRPGDFNQAMMELGATVCLPRGPDCRACPVKRWCGTRGEHQISAQIARKAEIVGHLLAVSSTKISLIQRPKTARLMPGMWELPRIPAPLPRRRPVLKLRHSITKTDYVVKVWRGPAPAGSIQLNLKKAAKLPLTGLSRKILRRLRLINQE